MHKELCVHCVHSFRTGGTVERWEGAREYINLGERRGDVALATVSAGSRLCAVGENCESHICDSVTGESSHSAWLGELRSLAKIRWSLGEV